MAMIHCPRCGKEISDETEICPDCRLVLNGEWKYPPPPKPGVGGLITPLIFALVSVGLFLLGKWMYPYSGWLLPVLVGIVSAIITIVAIWWHFDMVDTYNLSQTDPEAYQKKREEQQEKQIKLMEENQRQEADRLSKLPPCPICGSKAGVKRISATSRAVSATAWGLASSKIGKQYECTHCKHYF